MGLITQIMINLSYMGLALLFLIGAWLANFIPSIYTNIAILQQPWDRGRLFKGLLKIFILALGLSVFTVVVTSIPVFFVYMGAKLPDGFETTFSIVAIVASFFVFVVDYLKKSLEKLRNILKDFNPFSGISVEDKT